MNHPFPAEPPPLRTNPDGAILIGHTRVTLDTVVAEFEAGATAAEIAEQYSSIALADIYTVIGYYLNHQTEISQYLQAREELGQQVRAENEQRFPSQGLHDRLLDRRAAKVSNQP
jgi:uncharacterized protein (DUF433 family)